MQTNAKTARPGTERKRPDRKPKKQAPARKVGPQTAQQTIPYRELFKDGICRVNDRFYTKSLEYEDINYQLAQADDQSAIFDGYCAFLNSFDSSLPFQLSFINHRSRPDSKYKINIPQKTDSYSEMRSEYVEMLEGQIAKSNNGIVRTKLLTFGVSADSLAIAKPRLERVEADITGNFKKLGVQSRPLNGLERLEILHGQLHPGGTEPFSFTWDMIPKTGMGTKDFVAPTSFDFRQSRLFRMGSTWGAASYMQIMASELSDKLLAELLEVDAEMTITMHIQTVDQAKAIKTIKGKARGSGLIFVLCIALVSMAFLPFKVEYVIYTVLLIASMLSGYFDDAAETAWNEYKKGLIDFVIAIVAGATYLNFNGCGVHFLQWSFTLPYAVYLLLIVILIWASINVVNCTDGVDGLSASVAVVTIGTYLLAYKTELAEYGTAGIVFMGALLAYLWSNAKPSSLLMGDAGSRAMGFFIAMLSLKCGHPFAFLLAAIVFIVDGSLGIIKISLKRFLHVSILKNTRTPLHDHVRKNKGWSDEQVVARWLILQCVASALLLFLVRG